LRTITVRTGQTQRITGVQAQTVQHVPTGLRQEVSTIPSGGVHRPEAAPQATTEAILPHREVTAPVAQEVQAALEAQADHHLHLPAEGSTGTMNLVLMQTDF